MRFSKHSSHNSMQKLSLSAVLSALTLALNSPSVLAADQFSVEAFYKDGALTSLIFDYREGRNKAIPGFSANNVHVAGSACYARIPGSDNLSAYLQSIKNKPLYREIEETRGRMRAAVGKNKLDVWQEVLCVSTKQPIPYSATGANNGGKWSSIPITLNGDRQGAWNDVFTVLRPNHIYSITVHPTAIKPQN